MVKGLEVLKVGYLDVMPVLSEFQHIYKKESNLII